MQKGFAVVTIPSLVSLSCLFFLCTLTAAGQRTNNLAVPCVTANTDLDKKTVIKKSDIPHAGNGLFARVAIKKGETIGEYGGKLVSDSTYPAHDDYIVYLPECAVKKLHPCKYIDGDPAVHVTRINFAPSAINGIETGFQNAQIEELCEAPYIKFVALRDIRPGEEILSSYGNDFSYYPFMKDTVVQDYFCKRLNITRSPKFEFMY